MVGRGLILAIIAMFILVGIVARQLNASSEQQLYTTLAASKRLAGKNIAQTGLNMALNQLTRDTTWRSGFGSAAAPLPAFGGKLYVTVENASFFGRPTTRVTSVSIVDQGVAFDSGYYGSVGERRDTAIAYTAISYVPGTVRAAITTNNNVQTNGNIVVDGREHDTSGAVIANSGTWAIWTTKNYVMPTGSSTMGGTPDNPRTDVAPTGWPQDSVVIRTNQVWPGGIYPGSPDSVLGGASRGFPEGTLKAIAKSGMGGSKYYSSPPPNGTVFRGVTYIELPTNTNGNPNNSWTAANFSGEGILIIHNSSKNAVAKSIQGNFRGLIITDDMDKLNGANILGAIICLTPNPSQGNVIGNGTGVVRFSSQAVAQATTSYLQGSVRYSSWNSVLAFYE